MEIAPQYAAFVAAIEKGQTDVGVAEVRRLLEEGHRAYDIFQDGIVPYLKDLGDRFGRMECFLPDLMLASKVVKAIQPVLREHLQGATMESQGRIVIGTVYGDIHDIGKNIVGSMFEAHGFEVIDLGVGVPAQEFLRRAREHEADIVAMSALLNTCIPYMSDAIKLIRERETDGRRFKVLVGGGPVTAEIAGEIGADGYGSNAAEAVTQARALLGMD